jgi:RimJ/RimL family protein N-acetyltransferase
LRQAINTISAMPPRQHYLRNGLALLIREAAVEDAQAILNYLEDISGESDFLTFGPGEFEFTLAAEDDLLRRYRYSDNQLFILGLIDDMIVATLTFSAGRRPRLRHSGEFGMSVRKQNWGLGIGSLMLDTLIGWARATQIVKKINLRVRTDNQRAVALYKSRGFVIEGTIRKEIFLNGTYFDQNWMGLEL